VWPEFVVELKFSSRQTESSDPISTTQQRTKLVSFADPRWRFRARSGENASAHSIPDDSAED